MTEREKLVAKIMDIGYNYKNCNAMVREQQAVRAVNMLKEYESKAFDLGAVSNWVAVDDSLPKPLQTVWLTNGKGWTCLGCLVETNEGWHWAESNGVIYQENGEIVSECESNDLDVAFWHEIPKPPCC